MNVKVGDIPVSLNGEPIVRKVCYFPIIKIKEDISMNEVLELLPVLAIAVAMNICAGIYYNIGKQELKFDWKKLISGIIKAAIVAFLFIGGAFCFDKTDLSQLGLEPKGIMTVAIAIYVGKAMTTLTKILGVNTKNDANIDSENNVESDTK